MVNIIKLIALVQASAVLGKAITSGKKGSDSLKKESTGKQQTKGISFFTPTLRHSEFTITPAKELSSISSKSVDPSVIAKGFIAERFKKATLPEYVIKSQFKSKMTGVTHVYLRQVIDGKEVFNGDINLNINTKGNIISYGDSFYRGGSGGKASKSNVPPKFKSSPKASIESLLKHLNIQVPSTLKENSEPLRSKGYIEFTNIPGSWEPAKSTLGWLQLSDNTVEPVWNHQVNTNKGFFNAYVSANTNDVVSLTDSLKRASYKAVPFGEINIDKGKHVMIENPEDKMASPRGWHDNGYEDKSTLTKGNNVMAYKFSLATSLFGSDDEGLVDGGKNLKFDYPVKTGDPSLSEDASAVNLFYYINCLHDIFYSFGFNEEAGNYQDNNFGKGGKESDPILAFAQYDAEDTEMKFFSPKDGVSGKLLLSLTNFNKLKRDPIFDSTILIHEISHGLSERLVGGKDFPNCLVTPEGKALAEGWSDAIPMILLLKPNGKALHDFGVGEYISGRKTVRTHMYSTSMKTDPLTFSWLNKEKYKTEHEGGEIWASTILDIYSNLLQKLKPLPNFNSLEDDKILLYSNTLLLKILIEGMASLKCNPTFLQARDSMIQAEKDLTGEKYKCELWRGFAKRGMGINAAVSEVVKDGKGTSNHKDSHELPKGC